MADVCAQIEAACAQWAEPPGPNIVFTGVEALRHPDLSLLLQRAMAAGAQRVRLATDAVALQSGEVADKILRAGVNQIEVVVRGSEDEAQHALAGATAPLSATLAGVGAFLDAASRLGAKVHVAAKVPVCRHNVHDLPGIVTAAAKAQISLVAIVVEDAALDPAGIAPWVEAACDTGIVSGTWVEVEGLPYCLASGWELHLASVYRDVDGVKAASCETCPLDEFCGGLARGADPRLAARLQPPALAAYLAEGIRRGFDPALVIAGAGATRDAEARDE